MSNLGSASVEGDPLLPFLFKLMFSSALRDEIGVFKPVSLLFMVRRVLEGLCDMTLVHTAFFTHKEHLPARLREALAQNVQD